MHRSPLPPIAAVAPSRGLIPNFRRIPLLATWLGTHNEPRRAMTQDASAPTYQAVIDAGQRILTPDDAVTWAARLLKGLTTAHLGLLYLDPHLAPVYWQLFPFAGACATEIEPGAVVNMAQACGADVVMAMERAPTTGAEPTPAGRQAVDRLRRLLDGQLRLLDHIWYDGADARSLRFHMPQLHPSRITLRDEPAAP